jgi:hypothetical protein
MDLERHIYLLFKIIYVTVLCKRLRNFQMEHLITIPFVISCEPVVAYVRFCESVPVTC